MSTVRQYLKNNGKNNVLLWILLFSLTGVLGTVISIVNTLISGKNKAAIAYVDDTPILASEFTNVYIPMKNQINNIKKHFGEEADLLLRQLNINDANLEHEIIDRIATQKVISNVMSELGVQISSSYLESKLRDTKFVKEALSDIIPQELFVNDQLDPAIVEKFLTMQGLSEDDLEDLIKQRLSSILFIDMIKDGVYVTDKQLKSEYLKKISKKKFNVIELNFDKYISQEGKKNISDADLEKFYQDNKNVYAVPEVRTANEYVFDAKSYGITVTDADVEKYYNTNKDSYIKTPARYTITRLIFKTSDNEDENLKTITKANKLAFDLRSVEPAKIAANFIEKAKELEKSGEATVKTNSFGEGELGPQVEDLVEKLTKEAPVSRVTRTPEGIEIFKLDDKTPAVYKSLAEVRDQITKEVTDNKFNSSFGSDVKILLSQAQDNPAKLKDFVASKKGVKKTVTLKKGADSLEANKLFTLTKTRPLGTFNQEDNQESKGYILELVKTEPSFIPEFAKIKNDVKEDYIRSKAIDALKADLSKAKDLISKDPAKAAQAVNSTVTRTDWIDRDKRATQANLSNQGIDVNQILDLTVPGQAVEQFNIDSKGRLVNINKGKKGFVISLNEIEPLKEDLFNKKKNQLRQEEQARDTQEILLELIKSLKEKAKIEINQAMFIQLLKGLKSVK